MKKILLGLGAAVALLLSANTSQAQYKKGDKLLDLGLGLNSYYTGGIPLSGIFEYGASKQISVGGGIDYLSYHYGIPGNSYSYTSTYIAARGSFHFSEMMNLNTNKLDIYAGLSLGYRSFSWGNGFNGNGLGLNGYYGSGLYLGIHGGARYYFSNKVAGFMELGAMGLTNARIGVTFKL
ncbi:MAG TPA: hypothetical protein VKQ08_03670 [Cyclobacteriaceae bacterium]|nr:hypothetical protein [Cyclobacteriaceae bacterium]